ncbi:MAG: tetratricopeptide repeat protein [Nanoarchaeota archaeon]
MKKIILLLSLIFITSFAWAETIKLKSGKTVEGKITERTDEYIKVDIVGVPISIFTEEIEGIDGYDNEFKAVTRNKISEEDWYKNDEFKIKIKIPQGWQFCDKDTNPQDFFGFLSSPQLIPQSIAVFSDGKLSKASTRAYVQFTIFKDKPLSNEEFVFINSKNAKKMEASNPNIEIEELYNSIELDGKKFIRYIVHFSPPGEDVETYVYYYLLKGDYWYTITYQTEKSKYAQYKYIFSDMVASISVEEFSEAELLSKSGEFKFYAGSFDEAIDKYEKALEKANNADFKAEILLQLSAAYLEIGIKQYISQKDDSYYQKSIEYANKCLDIHPENGQALANIGTVYMNMNYKEKAVHYFKQAEKYVDKNSPDGQRLSFQLRFLEEALRQIKQKEDSRE